MDWLPLDCVSRMVRAWRYWIGRCRNWTARRFAGRFAKKRAKVTMILLTSKGLKPDIVTGLGSGAADYLTKPFEHRRTKSPASNRSMHSSPRGQTRRSPRKYAL